MKGRKELAKIVDEAVHHYMRIVFEEFQHRLDLVLERVDALCGEVRDLRIRLDKLENRVESLEAFVRAAMKNIERLLAIHDADIASLKKKAG